MSYEKTKQWKKRNPEMVSKQLTRYYAQADETATNTKAKWTADEDRDVLAQATSDPVLARKLGRTIRAVQHRRHVLRKKSFEEMIMLPEEL